MMSGINYRDVYFEYPELTKLQPSLLSLPIIQIHLLQPLTPKHNYKLNYKLNYSKCSNL